MEEQKRRKTTFDGHYERHQELYEKKMALLNKELKMRDDVTSLSPVHIAKVETSVQDFDEGHSVPSSMCYLKKQALASVTECFGTDKTWLLKDSHIADANLEDFVYVNRKVSGEVQTEAELHEDLTSYNGVEESEDFKISKGMHNDYESLEHSACGGTEVSVQLLDGCISSQVGHIPGKPLCSAGYKGSEDSPCEGAEISERLLDGCVSSQAGHISSQVGHIPTRPLCSAGYKGSEDSPCEGAEISDRLLDGCVSSQAGHISSQVGHIPAKPLCSAGYKGSEDSPCEGSEISEQLLDGCVSSQARHIPAKPLWCTGYKGSEDSACEGTEISVRLLDGCISSQAEHIPAKPLCRSGYEGSEDFAYDGTEISVQLPDGCISSQAEHIAAKLICSAGVLQCEAMTNSERSDLQNALTPALQSVDYNNGTSIHENDQNLIVTSSTAVYMLKTDLEDAHSDDSEKQERTECFGEHQTSLSEREGSTKNHESPSHEVGSSEVVSDLEVEDKIIIKRNREALSSAPSGERLKILDNIYRIILDQANSWQPISGYSCNLRLVFSILEAAKMGTGEIGELLRSECNGLQSLMCYKAICELVSTFPEEDLFPTKFVKEYLLVMDTSNLYKKVKKNDALMAYQEEESTLFWSALIRPALSLVTLELASVTHILSMFSHSLSLTSRRFKDLLSKEEFNEARQNFDSFIIQLVTEKMESPFTSSDTDCCVEELSSLSKQRDDSIALSPMVEKIDLQINQEVTDEARSSSLIGHEKSPSCLSCKLIMRVLFCRKTRAKHT